jgi:predicted nuclease of predicted toxin-antitoxin system
MRVYLDEDLASGLLVSLLVKAGHDVAAPASAGLLGRSDAVQLTYAMADNRVCLSRNYEDFEELHLLLQQGQDRHLGIIVVRRENDPTRDMTPKGIVAAIRKLEAAGVPIANEYIVLNQWR